MNEQVINSLMSMMMQMMNLTQQLGSSIYNSQAGSMTNTYSYMPKQDILSMVSRMFFDQTNIKEVAPASISQLDMEMMREKFYSDMRFSQQRNINPLVLGTTSKFLNSVGITGAQDYLFDPTTGQASFMGKMVQNLAETAIGSLHNPWMEMGTMGNVVRDTMRGFMSNDPTERMSAFNRQGKGISNKDTDLILKQIMGATYKDDMMLETRGLWNNQDMMEIFRMSRDYGVFKGAKTEDIASRVINMGDTVKQAMGTFNVGTKEEGLKEIINLFGGTVNLNDTSKIRQALDQVKYLSESSNLSIDLIKRVIGQANEIAKSLDIPSGNVRETIIHNLGRAKYEGKTDSQITANEQVEADTRFTLSIMGGGAFKKMTQVLGAAEKIGGKLKESDAYKIYEKEVIEGKVPTAEMTKNLEDEMRNALPKDMTNSQKNAALKTLEMNYSHLAKLQANSPEDFYIKQVLSKDNLKDNAILKKAEGQRFGTPEETALAKTLLTNELFLAIQADNSGLTREQAWDKAQRASDYFMRSEDTIKLEKRELLLEQERTLERESAEIRRNEKNKVGSAVLSLFSGQGFTASFRQLFPGYNYTLGSSEKYAENLYEYGVASAADPSIKKRMENMAGLFGENLTGIQQLKEMEDVVKNIEDVKEKGKVLTGNAKTLYEANNLAAEKGLTIARVLEKIPTATIREAAEMVVFNNPQGSKLTELVDEYKAQNYGAGEDDYLKFEVDINELEKVKEFKKKLGGDNTKYQNEQEYKNAVYSSGVLSPEEKNNFMITPDDITPQIRVQQYFKAQRKKLENRTELNKLEVVRKFKDDFGIKKDYENKREYLEDLREKVKDRNQQYEYGLAFVGEENDVTEYLNKVQAMAETANKNRITDDADRKIQRNAVFMAGIQFQTTRITEDQLKNANPLREEQLEKISSINTMEEKHKVLKPLVRGMSQYMTPESAVSQLLAEQQIKVESPEEFIQIFKHYKDQWGLGGITQSKQGLKALTAENAVLLDKFRKSQNNAGYLKTYQGPDKDALIKLNTAAEAMQTNLSLEEIYTFANAETKDEERKKLFAKAMKQDPSRTFLSNIKEEDLETYQTVAYSKVMDKIGGSNAQFEVPENVKNIMKNIQEILKFLQDKYIDITKKESDTTKPAVEKESEPKIPKTT